MDKKTKNCKRKAVLMLESRWANRQSQQDFECQVGSSPEKKDAATQTVKMNFYFKLLIRKLAAMAEVQRNTAERVSDSDSVTAAMSTTTSTGHLKNHWHS